MNEPIMNIIIIVFTICFSIRGFKDFLFREKYIFDLFPIQYNKEYYRIVTSSFLHLNGIHLALNMLCLYSFGKEIELVFGREIFVIIYIGSVIGGGLLSLYFHKNDEYRALGASGGVSGIMIASIFLFPGGNIGMLFPPISLPSWLFVIIFITLSIYGIRTQAGNVGHDAHLGGAITGLILTSMMYPSIITKSPKLFSFVVVICAVFFLYFIKNPIFITAKHSFKFRIQNQKLPLNNKLDVKYDYEEQEKKLDQILDKISKSGIGSLSQKEKNTLNKISRKKRSKLE